MNMRTTESELGTPSLELSSQQAQLAFERNLLSLDQSLLGAIRTSLSLIGFGFAMILFFHQVSGHLGVNLRVPARNFGLSLVIMGVGMVSAMLLDHRRRLARLRDTMNELHSRGLLRAGFEGRTSYVGLFGHVLLLVGLLVIAGILIRIGPFQDFAAPDDVSRRPSPATHVVPQ